MNNLETQLNAKTLHEMDSKSALSVIKAQFERFINSDLLKPLDIYSRSFSSDREVRENFRDYTKITAQTFKETIIQNMNSIEQYLAPQRQEMSVENVASGLVPQGQKASDYDNSDPVPPRQNVVPTAEKTDSSQQGLEFLFSPLIEEYYNPTHGQAEENNNDQAPNASFQEAEFINPFCTRVQEIGESSSRNIDNTDVHSFQPQSHDYRWTRDHPLEQVRGNPTMPVQTRRQLATDPEMFKECECLAQKLSKQTESVNKEIKDAKSHNTTKRYVPVEKSSASKKPERQIPTGHRWIPTGKLLNSCTGKVESEPTHGSNVDIHHIHACKQTLGLSAGTSFNGQKQQRIDLNADALYNEKQENLRVWGCLEITDYLRHGARMVSQKMKSSAKTFDRSRSSLGLHGNDV
ncbi:hypothetical protein Tco_0833732 [Tanacetum coccineum]